MESNLIKKCDQSVMHLFDDVIVLDDKGKASSVKLVFAQTEEMEDALDKQIDLPIMSLCRGDMELKGFNLGINYQLKVRTKFEEHMSQIVSTIVSKFAPIIKFAKGNCELNYIVKGIREENHKYSFQLKLTVDLSK